MIWNISGYDVLIDDADYERLKGYKYYVDKTKAIANNLFYFHRNVYINGRRTITKLHRDIMGYTNGDGNIVDHKDGNTLDCRNTNLRFSTNTENSRNQKIPCNNTSGVKGVYFNKIKHRWCAQISILNEKKNLGYFSDIKDAEKAYIEASTKYHGEFRRT